VIEIKDKIIFNTENKMKQSLNSTQHEFNTIRTGRASAALLDRIFIDYYGSKTSLKHIANVSIPETRSIIISPYEPKFLNEIEKQILASDLGINPTNDGKVIRLAIPQLNEERRIELVKIIKKISEDGKVSIRNIRREVNDEIKKMEKRSDLTKDDRVDLQEKVQKITDKYIDKIDESLSLKEEEIMEV
jgi:ribosome recycling factor